MKYNERRALPSKTQRTVTVIEAQCLNSHQVLYPSFILYFSLSGSSISALHMKDELFANGTASGWKDMVYTRIYIIWDGLGSGYGMGSRGVDTISFKRYGFGMLMGYPIHLWRIR